MEIAQFINDTLNPLCPIIGVSVRDESDATTWSFTPGVQASPEQIRAAYAQMVSMELLWIKAKTIRQLHESLYAQLNRGVVYNNFTFSLDKEVRDYLINILVLVQLQVIPLPLDFQWPDKQLIFHPFTQTDLSNLAGLCARTVYAAYVKLWALTQQVNSATDIKTLGAITW